MLQMIVQLYSRPLALDYGLAAYSFLSTLLTHLGLAMELLTHSRIAISLHSSILVLSISLSCITIDIPLKGTGWAMPLRRLFLAWLDLSMVAGPQDYSFTQLAHSKTHSSHYLSDYCSLKKIVLSNLIALSRTFTFLELKTETIVITLNYAVNCLTMVRRRKMIV
jgi:hypothetical protein